MPAKRRPPKTRPEAPLEAWGPLFAWGYDYFSDLRPYGVDPADTKAVLEAWRVLGSIFLDQWPRLRNYYSPGLPDAQPWALTALGDPRP